MAVKRRVRTRVKSTDESMARLSPPQLRQLTEVFAEVAESFGLNQADWELAMEDRGWLSLGNNQLGGELLGRRRMSMVARCRLFWRADPLAKQAVRLWTDYSIGKGIAYEVEDDDASQTALDKFFKYRRNKKLTSSKGQQRLSKKLLVDGDIFFAIFDGEPKVLRTIDPLQITEILSDTNDEEEVLGYKRVISGLGTSGYGSDVKPKTVYYQDWAADPDKLRTVTDPETLQSVTFEKKVVIYHLSFDDIGKWGNGLLAPVVDWSNSHRMFMQDRVAITRGLAKFVTKLTVKGGQAAVDQMRKKLESSLTQTGFGGGFEKNPSPAAGANWLQNNGVDMQASPRATGAGDAMSDGRMLKLQVCAGTGIFEHYFGDAANANLAIATAMEAPMLKMFQGYQELWMDVWQDLFAIVLDEDIDNDPIQINVSLPKILEEDLVKLGTYITSLTTIFPEAKVEDILRTCLEALGADDVDGILKAAKAQRAKIDAQQKADAKAAQDNAMALATAKAPAPAPAPTPAPAPATNSAAEVAALDRFSLALLESNRAPAMQPIIIQDSTPPAPAPAPASNPTEPVDGEILRRLTTALDERNRLDALPPVIPAISVNPEIVIVQEQGKAVVKSGRAKREANGDITIVMEEKNDGA